MTDVTSPVALKIALATRGMRVEAGLLAELAAVPDFAPRALDLVLPDDVRVLVQIEGLAADPSPYALVSENGQTVIVGEPAVHVAVRAGSVPRFYGRRTSSGRAMWQVGQVHGSHLLVTPTTACGFSICGAPCSFCREGARPAGRGGDAATIADVVDVVRAAFEEGVADFVWFNSSTYDAEDGGIGFLTPYIEAVRKHFDTFVAVQVHPPRTNVWIDRTYAMGVDAVSYNLELFHPDALGRHCIGRMRYIGRDRYLEALGHAATIFPAGTVWCDLVMGLEPAESTIAGIDALAEIGVVPVLSVFHPGQGGTAAVTPEDATGPVGHLWRAAHARRLATGWIRDLALGITPFEASRAAGGAARVDNALHAVTRWRFGAFAARGFARFRRRLRVRAISDSLESSHL